VLRGSLPRPEYPMALRRNAPAVWRGQGEATLAYAEHNHAPYGRLAQCAGMIATGMSQFAHAILAARGEWVTNEKTLLTRAGLRPVDEIVSRMTGDPGSLIDAVRSARELAHRELEAALAEIPADV